MRKYFIDRVIMIFEMFIVIVLFLFVLRKESIASTSISFISNNTVSDSSVDKSVMQETQKALYQQGTYNPIYTFVGDLTGYGGDCALCSGYLGCPPNINVLKKGILYNDKTYGTVRIVASSKKYSCGTILKFSVSKISKEPIIAIVLDRGVGGNNIDLLSESEDYARDHVGRVKNLTFEVLREGWK